MHTTAVVTDEVTVRAGEVEERGAVRLVHVLDKVPVA